MRIGMLKIVHCMHMKLYVSVIRCYCCFNSLVTFETMPLTTCTQVTHLPVAISSTNTTMPRPLILPRHAGTGRVLKKWDQWK